MLTPCAYLRAPRKQRERRGIYKLHVRDRNHHQEYGVYRLCNAFGRAYEQLDEEVKNNTIIFPEKNLIENCQTYTNLPEDILELYNDYWTNSNHSAFFSAPRQKPRGFFLLTNIDIRCYYLNVIRNIDISGERNAERKVSIFHRSDVLYPFVPYRKRLRRRHNRTP